MPTPGGSEQRPGRAPAGESRRSRSQFSRFFGGALRQSRLRNGVSGSAGSAAAKSTKREPGRGEEEREANGEPGVHPAPSRLVARWQFGGDSGVAHPGVAVPGWHRCPVALCYHHHHHHHPPRRHPGLGNRQQHDGVIWGQRLGMTLVPAAEAGGTAAAGTGLALRSLRAPGGAPIGTGQGALRVPGDACVCVCVFAHACVCVCTSPLRCRRVWPPAPTWLRGYFCLQPGFNSLLPAASV